MKRTVRRVSALLLGAVLGWSAAGLMQHGSVFSSVLYACEEHASAAAINDTGSLGSDDAHKSSSHATDEHAAEAHASHASTHHDHADHGHGHDDPAAQAASLLVVTPAQVPWFRSALLAAVGLFVAAVVLGIPSLKLRGPLPPEPADHHDDHAHHDTHAAPGHAHGHGHH